MSAHENLEHAEHAEHASHGGNKKIALLISVLALVLAFSETLGKSAQTTTITQNVALQRPVGVLPGQDHPHHRVEYREGTVADRGRPRYRSRDQGTADQNHRRLEKDRRALPKTTRSTHEGRKQLAERAKEAEHKRELALARYHQYEIASAAFQIGIVLASAEVITSMAVLGWLAGLVGVIGLGFMALRPVGAARAGFSSHAAALTHNSALTPGGCDRRAGAGA